MNTKLQIEEGVPLKGLSTFKVGGDAAYLYTIRDEKDILPAASLAKSKGLPLLVLGGGSNVLFSDDGYKGLVIKIETKGIEVVDHADFALIRVKAGELWDSFVAWTLSHKYFGLENLSAIPGTVGAAPIQNIGAYGVEAKDYIESVDVIDITTGERKSLTNAECQFGYRTSLFKKPEGRNYVVTSVVWKLSKQPQVMVDYKDLANHFSHTTKPSPIEVREAVVSIRRSKFPDLDIYGTAGSFWKNVILDNSEAKKLKTLYPDMPIYAVAEGRSKISTAFILDKVCGLKNFREGDVGLFERQTLVVTNYKNATSNDIKVFISKVKSLVKEKTGINLEEEVVVM